MLRRNLFLAGAAHVADARASRLYIQWTRIIEGRRGFPEPDSEDFAILVDKHLSSDYRNLLCLTAVFWMYQMTENKAVTETVPQEYCLSHYSAADGKVDTFQSRS